MKVDKSKYLLVFTLLFTMMFFSCSKGDEPTPIVNSNSINSTEKSSFLREAVNSNDSNPENSDGEGIVGGDDNEDDDDVDVKGGGIIGGNSGGNHSGGNDLPQGR